MIHVIPHHIAKGSYTAWYDIIEFKEDVIFHNFENKEQIEGKHLGEPPYEDELIKHLNEIRPTINDIVFFDYKYFNGYNHLELEQKLNQLSRKYNNTKFVLFDDDNSIEYMDTDRFTIFSNMFRIKYSDLNCNYYRYRASKQEYFPHLKYITNTFINNIRQKKANLIIGVDKIERLEIFKYVHSIKLDKDLYLGYSGFTSTYTDDEISKSLLDFKKEKIPTILDTPFWMSEMGSVNVEIPPLPFTMNSYVSCILETQILLDDSIHLSEKSFNPFISLNIPLILASGGVNEYLKKQGFWLAEDLFDLETKTNRTDILNQYRKNLDVINNMSIDDLHNYYIDNINNIERNFRIIEESKFTYDSNLYKSLKKRSN